MILTKYDKAYLKSRHKIKIIGAYYAPDRKKKKGKANG